MAVAEGVAGRAEPDRRRGRTAYGHPLAACESPRAGRASNEQVLLGEVPFAGTYEKDDHGMERIHGTFKGVVHRSPTGDSGLWGCPDGTLFQSVEMDLSRRRVN